jgi:hypothetical protein
LPAPYKRQVWFLGWMVWMAYGYALGIPAVALPLMLGFIGLIFARVIRFGFALTGLVMLAHMRRVVVRVKNRRMQTLVRRVVGERAKQVDDWGTLDEHSDGTLVSLVGWARARQRLAQPVCGERCIGIALGCQMNYPGVLESVHDFDLIDEQGRKIPILVAGGRLFGEPNVRVFSDPEGRMLVASLDLPAGAVPTADALALRDGDPLMIVGFKTSIADDQHSGMREAPVQVVIASAETLPLLIYPLAAERNPSPAMQVPWG